MASSRQQQAALERLVDLALFMAAHPDRPISGSVIKAEIYDALLARPQTDSAFRRMFKRDREQLGAAGLRITSDPQGAYVFDSRLNYSADLKLSRAQRAAAALAAVALADDPLFPAPVALRLALIKLNRVLDEDGSLLESGDAPLARIAVASGAEADEDAPAPAPAASVPRWTELIMHAQLQRQRVDLRYRDQRGAITERTVAPYGLFLLGGQWYLCGDDSLRRDIRVFAIQRIQELRISARTFVLPDDFSVERWRQLPFRLSGEARDRTARLLIPAARAKASAEITRNKGVVEPAADGALLWTIPYPSAQQDRALRYALEEGLSFTEDSPAERKAQLRALEEVARAHA